MFTDVSLALNPSICFVGCQCQVYVLRKAIAPLGTQQASETVIFIFKITITTKSPILNIAPMGTHSTLHCPKKSKITAIWHITTTFVHLVGLC